VLVLLVMLFSGLAAANLFRFSDVQIAGLTLTASFQAAVIGLGIHEGAYMAEIVRNGIQAVARGQIEAARSLGMSAWQVTYRIVIPQAMRVIVPPFGNDFNHMLKTTSLASVIGVQEIFLLTESMSATTFKTFELLTVVALNYLVLTAIWNSIQGVIETRLRAHEIDRPVRTWWQSIVAYLSPSTDGTERRA
jgi:polar amino acid transport system permease protein